MAPTGAKERNSRLSTGIKKGSPNPRWKRRFFVRSCHRFLKGTKRLAGIRSVLSHARKMAAKADERIAKAGPKGVIQPRMRIRRETTIGINALGISCLRRWKQIDKEEVFLGSVKQPWVTDSVILDMWSMMTALKSS